MLSSIIIFYYMHIIQYSYDFFFRLLKFQEMYLPQNTYL